MDICLCNGALAVGRRHCEMEAFYPRPLNANFGQTTKGLNLESKFGISSVESCFAN